VNLFYLAIAIANDWPNSYLTEESFSRINLLNILCCSGYVGLTDVDVLIIKIYIINEKIGRDVDP
jgi:hypothetical protein